MTNMNMHELDYQSITLNSTCTNTRILEYKRQLSLVDDALEAQKEDFVRKMDAFRRREEALKRKDLRLQESLIRFNKFLQENENKKSRANRRCAEEKRQSEKTEKEIAQLKRMLDNKLDEERNLSNLLSKNLKYQTYLKQVVEEMQGSDDFAEIQDILDRHATLKNTNKDLLAQIHVNTREHEARRFSYAQFMKKSANEMLNKNNEIARLQKELEQVTISSNKVESLDYGNCRNVNELTSDISRAVLAIGNMMTRLKYHAHPSLSKNASSPKGDEEDGLENKVNNAINRLNSVGELLIDYECIASD